MSKIKKVKNNNSGFSIFVAVVVVGVLMVVVVSAALLSGKEANFATTNRDSQYAISAADSGIECALYWDAKAPVPGGSAFSTSTSGSPISCGGTSLSAGSAIAGTTTLTRIGGGGDANATSTFGFSLHSASNPSNACAVVTVNKRYVGVDLVTWIYSRGYNNCNISDPRRVERGIEVRY